MERGQISAALKCPRLSQGNPELSTIPTHQNCLGVFKGNEESASLPESSNSTGPVTNPSVHENIL